MGRLKALKKKETVKMEGLHLAAVCIICSEDYSWEGGGKTRGSVLSALKSWGNEEERARSLLEEFKKQLGVEREVDLMEVLCDKEDSKSYTWTLCGECYPVIKKTVEQRRRSLKVEEKLIKLQLRVVDELRNLKKGMAQFYVELRGVEELTRRGDVAYFDMVEGRLSTVNLLRKRIFDVVNELQLYQNDLNARLDPPKIKMEETETAVAKVAVKEESDLESHSRIVDNFDGDDGSRNDDTSHSKNKSEPLSAHRIIPGQQEKIPMAMNSGTLLEKGDPDQLEDLRKANEKVTISVRKRKADADAMEIDDNPSSSDDEIEASNDNPEPTAGEDDSSSENEWEGTPSSPSSSKKSKWETGKPPNSQASSTKKNESKISCLRDVFIERTDLYKKLYDRKLSEDSKDKKTSESCGENKMSYMKYDPTTGKFTLGDVELAIDDEAQLVRCGSCPFQVTCPETLSFTRDKYKNDTQVGRKLIQQICGHIHVSHLGTFKCPECGVKKPTRRYLNWHVKKSHSGTTVPCDICGREMKSRKILELHKFHHMNAEEKEEAIRNGKKVPTYVKQRAKQIKTNLDVSCDICHKQVKMSNLKLHQLIHSGEQERVICSICGKSILKRSFESYHKKYSCPIPGSGMDPSLLPKKCIHCPATFKSRNGLTAHMKRLHPTEGEQRTHMCHTCGMRFKSKHEVERHMLIHQTERLWKCSRSCGRDFNVKLNWKRHEVSCKFKKDAGAADDGVASQMDQRQGGTSPSDNF